MDEVKQKVGGEAINLSEEQKAKNMAKAAKRKETMLRNAADKEFNRNY